MSDRTNNDLAGLLASEPPAGVQFSQGKIITWERTELRNTIEWRGITLTDVPMIEGLNNLVLKPDDVVGLMGWAPEYSKGIGTWWIIGKLSNPGEFIADLTFYLGQVRFRTKNGEYDQVYFGSDTDGDPLTILYYGDSASSRALTVSNANEIRITDTNGNILFGNDTLSGVGLADPWIPYYIGPASAAQNSGTSALPGTGSAAFVLIMQGINPVYHPRITIGFGLVATGTTGWEVRVDTGSGETTVGSGSGASIVTFDVPGWGVTVQPGALVTVRLYARNTTGGFSSFTVDRFYGRQS